MAAMSSLRGSMALCEVVVVRHRGVGSAIA